MLSNSKKKKVIKKVIKESKHKPGVVYLVRHGATRMNSSDVSKDKIRGWLNIPLDGEGKREAKNLGEYLKDKNIDKMYYSDMFRTTETAEIINKYLKLKRIVSSKSLRPWNLGDLQGRSSKVVAPEIVKYMKNPKDKPSNGEKWEIFLSRYLGKMRDLLDEAERTGDNLAIVAHYRNLKVAEAWDNAGMKGNLVDEKTMENWKLETGAIYKFTKKGNKWMMEHIKIN